MNFKKPSVSTQFVKGANDASKLFLANGMMKLGLRAKLIAISINWETLKSRGKQADITKYI
jgi:hypothetical protein